MPKIQTELEMLLKFRALGKELIDKTEMSIDDLSKAQRRSTAATKAGSAASLKQKQSFTRLLSTLKSVVVGYVGLQTARKAIELSNVQERAEIRLLGILKAQAGAGKDVSEQFARLKDLASKLQTETGLFGDEAFLRAAGDLLAVGGDLQENLRLLPDRLRAAAGAGLVFFEGDLDASVRNLSRTLGGLVGELGEKLPALNALLASMSQEQRQAFLRGGGAFTFLGDLAREALGTAQGAGFVRQQTAANEFGDALEKAGDAIKIVFLPSIKLLAAASTRLASIVKDAASSDKLQPAGTLTGKAQQAFADILTIIQTGASPDELRRVKEVIARADNPPRAPATDAAGAGASKQQVSEDKLRSLREELGILDKATVRLDAIGAKFDELAGGPLDTILTDDILDPSLRELGVLKEIALATEDATTETDALAAAQAKYEKVVADAREASEAGLITDARRKEIVASALDDLRTAFKEGVGVSDELTFTLGDLFDTLKSLGVSDALVAPEEVDQLRAALDAVAASLNTTKENVAGLSTELGDRLKDQLANVIDGLATGTSSVKDFGLAFIDTLRRILAEQAALKLLQGLFGGTGEAVGGGGKLGGSVDKIGGFFGFAQGGLVSGPDLGRDDRLIAVRGREFVVRPEAVRLPGALPMLEALNASGAAVTLPRLPGPERTPGFAGGGLVDRFAPSSVSSPAASTTVVPAIVLDDDLAERLFSGRNLDALAGAMARRRADFAAVTHPAPSASGGLTR